MPDDQSAPPQPSAVAERPRGRPWTRMGLAALNCVAIQCFAVRALFCPTSSPTPNPHYFWIAIYGWFTISALFRELLPRERHVRAEMAGHVFGALAALAFAAAVSEEPLRVTAYGAVTLLIFPASDLLILFVFRRTQAATAKAPTAARTGDELRPPSATPER